MNSGTGVALGARVALGTTVVADSNSVTVALAIDTLCVAVPVEGINVPVAFDVAVGGGLVGVAVRLAVAVALAVKEGVALGVAVGVNVGAAAAQI